MSSPLNHIYSAFTLAISVPNFVALVDDIASIFYQGNSQQ
jgi:hypothetical protein